MNIHTELTAEQFKSIRKQLSMTQAQLAQALGRSKISITKYETGANHIPRVVCLALSALTYNMPITITHKPAAEEFDIQDVYRLIETTSCADNGYRTFIYEHSRETRAVL